MKTFEDLRQGVGSWWDSVAEGWDRLRRSANDMVTSFRPGEKTDLPASEQLADDIGLPNPAWALMGGDIYEDDRRVVVRLEAPGLEKQDFDIQVVGDTMVVSGEKRFERESTEGCWRSVQCAYGSFRRSFALPAKVAHDGAKASYRNGVLKVELPKLQTQRPAARRVTVN